MSLVGFYIAATVVALMQLIRTRDRRVLPLLALFLCLAEAHSRTWDDPWHDRSHFGAGIAGLTLLFVLGRERAR